MSCTFLYYLIFILASFDRGHALTLAYLRDYLTQRHYEFLPLVNWGLKSNLLAQAGCAIPIYRFNEVRKWSREVQTELGVNFDKKITERGTKTLKEWLALYLSIQKVLMPYVLQPIFNRKLQITKLDELIQLIIPQMHYKTISVYIPHRVDLDEFVEQYAGVVLKQKQSLNSSDIPFRDTNLVKYMLGGPASLDVQTHIKIVQGYSCAFMLLSQSTLVQPITKQQERMYMRLLEDYVDDLHSEEVEIVNFVIVDSSAQIQKVVAVDSTVPYTFV